MLPERQGGEAGEREGGGKGGNRKKEGGKEGRRLGGQGRQGEGKEGGMERGGNRKKEGGKKKEVSAKLNENVIIVINFYTDNLHINSDQLIVLKVNIIGV